MATNVEIVDSCSEFDLLKQRVIDRYGNDIVAVVELKDFTQHSGLVDFLESLDIGVVGYKFERLHGFLFLKCDSMDEARSLIRQFHESNYQNKFKLHLSVFDGGFLSIFWNSLS